MHDPKTALQTFITAEVAYIALLVAAERDGRISRARLVRPGAVGMVALGSLACLAAIAGAVAKA